MSQPKCPVSQLGAAFDAFDLSNPFPLLKEARATEAVFFNEQIDYWIVTRYEDIKAVFQDHDSFTAENTITPIVPFPEQVKIMLSEGNYTPVPVLSNNVPPSHTRIRRLVNKLFLPRRMRHFEPAIRQLVHDSIDSFIEQGSVDIVDAMTYELPAQVLFHVLGVPDEDVPQVKIWAGNRIKLFYGRPTEKEQIELTKYLVPFWHYVVALVESKLDNPPDDLTGDLIKMRNGDDDILTVNEIASCMITLLVAGHETTTAQITNGLLHFLDEREQWETLCTQPDLIPNAIEEMMRYDPSVNTWRRKVRKATTIAGVNIPEGANLLLMLNSANRDESIFPEPDKINVTRTNLKEHLALGYGIHYCVGAPLARVEMVAVFEALTERLPSLRLGINDTLEYVPNISFRGPLRLNVAWDEKI